MSGKVSVYRTAFPEASCVEPFLHMGEGLLLTRAAVSSVASPRFFAPSTVGNAVYAGGGRIRVRADGAVVVTSERRDPENAHSNLPLPRLVLNFRREPFHGKRPRSGQHSIRVNAQYRICFRWETGHADDVEITDYH